jgi:hypothetical protein
MSSGVLDPNVLIFVQRSPVFPRASASLHRGLRALVSRLADRFLLFFKVTFPIYLIPSRKLEMSGKIYVFDVLYNLRNSERFHPQNAWNRIWGSLALKIFPGVHAPDPPRWSRAFGVRFAPPQKTKVWLRHC